MDAVLQQCFSPVPGVDVLGLFRGLVFTKIHNRTPISAAVSAGCDAQLISLDSQDFPSLYFKQSLQSVQGTHPRAQLKLFGLGSILLSQSNVFV